MESTVVMAGREENSDGGSEHRVERTFARAFVLGNTGTFVTYAIGTAVISLFWLAGAAIYAVYCVASTVAMWATVCVHCPYYGAVCPCGYSTMSTKLFRKGDTRLLATRYRLIWVYVAPSWLTPPIAAIPVLLGRFSWILLGMSVLFVVMAFIVTPLVSRVAGCCEYWRGCTVPIAGDRGSQSEVAP